ncbi:endonuclease [Streptomyces sp. SCSIO ZS0520]|uniref:endonuclease n=1 Tax=Streptomyces sp. SCSIO ZS0520 TaxID=2892996 RepID=UPI0021D94855|nr:endonuclease [Streptomyces sp. SCSIO ZS0520]
MARTTTRERTVDALLRTHGETYAHEAGIRLRDTPQPLYQTLVLAALLSARIRAGVAVAAARALFGAGMRTPERMEAAGWQQRVDALGEGHYRRYDESTATTLGKSARFVRERHQGDLRRMRAEADGDPRRMRALLREVPGIGPTGADIFLREVQDLWPEFAPYIDGKAVQGAERLGLPKTSRTLGRLVPEGHRAELAAGLVRAALDKGVVEEVREAVPA